VIECPSTDPEEVPMTSDEPGETRVLVATDRRESTLVVTLAKPDKLNALTPAMIGQLEDAWELAADPAIRAVVLTGAGRGFCAGADLRPDPSELISPTRSGLRHSYNPMLLKLAALGKPVIAAVNGAAAGAGLGLACAADLRIASTAAKFVPAFIKIGVVPDMGASYRIPRILGYERAFRWLLSGEPMTAQEALDAGLVQSVVEPEKLLESALDLCASLTAGTPSAVRLTTMLLRESFGASLPEQLEREHELQALAIADPERAAARAAVAASLRSQPSA
jgi:2-(1,2-epoxy-1,2-dihydrophenyl)acetyl-CoA isomerase